MTAKLSPSENPLTKPQNIEFVVNFLNESTHLKAYPFWKNLEREQKDTLVRYMTLRGMHFTDIYVPFLILLCRRERNAINE